MNILLKSNLRKSRGLSIGITTLIFTVALLLSATLIIIFDFLNDPVKQKQKLNAGEACALVARNIDGLDDEFFNNTLNDKFNESSITKGIGIQYAVKYGSGTITPFLFVSSMDRYNDKTIGKTEIVEEDKSINDNYCYIQYQYHTGGGYNIGDTFLLEMPGKNYEYKIRGYINNLYLGSYNNGLSILLIQDSELVDLENNYVDNKTIEIDYDLKDDINPTKFINRLALEIAKVNVKTEFHSTTYEETISNRTFVSVIFTGSFLVTAIILFLVVILMISNIISNYIKQNMQQIGVLKAIGYESKSIKGSLIIQFSLLSLIGSLLGSTLVYAIMPFLSKILVTQYGMPYNVSFTFIAFSFAAIYYSCYI